MIEAILFDADGLIINKTKFFSEHLTQDYKIAPEAILPFFYTPEFDQCRRGEADLKIVLQPYLAKWNWPGTADELVDYWLRKEDSTDQRFVDKIAEYRKLGVKCYLQSRQEKYRANYISDVMGYKKIFDALFFSADLGAAKPEREFWQAIYNKIQPVAKNEVLVWDNKQENIDSAKAFGFQAEFYDNFDDFLKIMRNYL